MRYRITPLTQLESIDVERHDPLSVIKSLFCEELYSECPKCHLLNFWRCYCPKCGSEGVIKNKPAKIPLKFRVENLDNGKHWIVEIWEVKVRYQDSETFINNSNNKWIEEK